MVFHETTLYNDKSGDSTNVIDTTFKNPKFVNLDISEFTPQDQTIDIGILVVSKDGVGPSTHSTVLCRSIRSIRALNRYSPSLDYILLIDSGEPESYKKALQDENSNKWELGMKDEMDSLLGNQTWDLTELPKGKKFLHNK